MTAAHARAIAGAIQPGAFHAKSHRDLLRALRALSTALLAASPDSDQVPVKQLSQELSAEAILNTARPDIQIQAATCFVELFKLSAPVAPWHGAILRSVMRVLIQQIGLIGESQSSSAMMDQFHILESLSVVKIPLVLLDDDGDDEGANMHLIHDLFSTLIQIASRGLPQPFENCIRDVLSCVLEEAEPVPRSLVMVLLATLLDHSAGAQRSCDLAKRVIRECKAILEAPVAEIIAALASAPSSPICKEIGSRARQFELIYELACLDPSLLRSSLSHLQDALESTNEDTRFQFVKLFGRIFSNEDCQLAIEFSLLLNAYLKRSTDIADRIREEFVAKATSVLPNVPDSRLQITALLVERAMDPCDRVRAVLVHSVCEIALTRPDMIEFVLLDAIGGRLLDKKPAVRNEALQGLSALFKTHCNRYWADSKPVPTHLKKFSWIPHKIISLYMISFPDKGQSIDTLIDDRIIDKSLEAPARTSLLLAVFATCNETQQKAFIKHYISDKHHAASLITDALQLRDRLRNCSEDQMKRLELQRDQRLQSLTAYLPAHIDLKQLQTLFEERDGNIFKWLRICTDRSRETVQIRAAVTELHGALTTTKKLQVVADAVAVAIAMVTLGADSVPHLFRIASSGENKKLAADAMSLLVAVAEETPLLFSSHLQSVADCVAIPPKNPLISDFSLKILSLCSASKIGVFPETRVLERFCLGGRKEEAGWSAIILCNNALTASLRSIISRSSAHLSCADPRLLPVLLSAATIARLQPQLFYDHGESALIVDFVMSLFADLSSDSLIDAKCIGLQMMTDFLIGLELSVTLRKGEESGAHREAVLRVLWSLMAKSTPESLLFHTVKSTLNFLTVPHIEGSIGPQEFSTLARILMDTEYSSVRCVMIDELWKHLIVLKLPFRYASLLALTATDSHPDFAKKCKKLLAVLVGRLRQASAMATRSNPASKSVAFSHMPEYALAYLLHALASQSDFDAKSAASLRHFAKYITTFLDALLTSHNHNFAFIITLLTCLRSAIPLSGTDLPIPPENLYSLSELTLMIIKPKYQGQEWSSLEEDRISGKIPLPAIWFRMLSSPVEPRSHLPPGFALKLLPGDGVASPSPKKSLTGKRQPTPKSERKPKRKKSLETTPVVGSRQLPPRRAKQLSQRSVSSLLDSDSENDDIISHEYEQISAENRKNVEIFENPSEDDSESKQKSEKSPSVSSPDQNSSIPMQSSKSTPLQEIDGSVASRPVSSHDNDDASESTNSGYESESNESRNSRLKKKPSVGAQIDNEEEGEGSSKMGELTLSSGSKSKDLLDVLMKGSSEIVESENENRENDPPRALQNTFRLTRSKRRR